MNKQMLTWVIQIKKQQSNVIWKPLRLILEVQIKFKIRERQVRLVIEHKESETQTKSKNYPLQ